MPYKNLLVHLELNGDNDGVLSIAAELAQRFESKVIGIAAAQPVQVLYDDTGAAGEVIAADRAEIDAELAACKARFLEALEGRVHQLEWRSNVILDSLTDYVAQQARAADLIITGKDIGGILSSSSRRVNIGQLAVTAGRPILLVPPGIASLPLRHVFIAWQDCREARRATADALPLLKAAGHATVLEVVANHDQAKAEQRVKDVASWLEQHQISGSTMAIGTNSAQKGYLCAELIDRHCDLLVAGAYGHSRLGEILFGGVTQDILLDPAFCVLFSH
jgi:nucleotide-binding universal stress UspA family protein